MELLANLFGNVREFVKARVEAHMKKQLMKKVRGLVFRVVGVVCVCFVLSKVWKHKWSLLGAIFGK